MTFRSIVTCMFLGIMATFSAQAVETIVTVRVLAKDAKFIGTSMGGAAVTIRDVTTGEILAEGLTAGGTGDTGRIMKTSRTRGDSLESVNSAHFTATFDLSEARLVEVTVHGPMNPNSSAVSASSQQWLVPGKHINVGDAWLIELRGLVVELLDPITEYATDTSEITLRARVRMLCGCPTAPGGLWDADKMEINAIVTRDGAAPKEVPLMFTGDSSHFAAKVPVEKGSYSVMLYAYQPATGNTGVFQSSFVIN